MSHFQLEKELQSALRLDTSLNIGRSTKLGASGNHLNSSRNGSLSTSRLLASASGGSADFAGPLKSRSQSATRLSPSRLLMGGAAGRSLSTSRGASPSRQTAGDGSGSRSRTPSLGRQMGDRFIPNRSTTDMDAAHHSLLVSNKENQSFEDDGQNQDDQVQDRRRRKKVAEMLYSADGDKGAGKDRILSFRQKAPTADEAHINSQKVLYSTGKPKNQSAIKERAVNSKPDRILDAPEFLDDFYLNQLDWSSNNHVAVGLFEMLYIWNPDDGSIYHLFSKGDGTTADSGGDDDHLTALSWVKEGNILAVGDSLGVVELWDVKHKKRMRKMTGHTDRIATVDWNAHILASGSRSGAVHLHDVRVANHHVATLNGHTQEVCGMKWSPDQGRLLATGANDNQVLLWDGRNTERPVHTLTAHQAAVKAISWCPWQPRTLATGGGTNCRHIKFWNSTSGNLLNDVDTGSQVSGIVWNEEYKELITSHGFSKFQLTLWKYPSMTKVCDLKGHSARVLLLRGSPDGSTVVSAAADETIRVWIPWPQKEKKADKKTKNPVSLFTQQRIR